MSEPSSSSSSTLQGSQPCRLFEFPEIQLATNDFDESLVIGHGGFGKIYRGTISNGSTPVDAAIKRLDSMSNQGAAEFWAEVEMLSKLRHCNLVSLIGYCNYGKEMILVYEYMPNGTLEDHLHKLGTPLSWVQRLKVCIGAGRGLHYLHTGTGIEVGVIHRDIKSSNILLHESWAAKISDFGLSKTGPTNQPSTYVNTLVKGSFGYIDPDYFFTGRLTRKSDVYAVGVVLLEMLCRKRAVDKTLDEEQWNLARWPQESIKEGNLKRIIDSDIRDQISPKCLKEFVRIVERCLHSNPKQRSTMAEVVVSLESVLTLQEKFNSSLQPAGRTIFGRMVDMLPIPSNGENSAQGDSKLSSNTKGNTTSAGHAIGADHDMFLDKRELPADLNEFKFADLIRATRNFSPDLLLGQGSFGMVFLGWVDKNTFAPSRRGVGLAVAVKRMSQTSMQGRNQWLAEVSVLGRLTHPNIISILGYCNNIGGHEYLLVYEYMQNRSFDRFLYTNTRDINVPLSWETRLSIMIGVARGLAYMHSFEDQVILRHVKAADIFLDQDFNAKLGDFGLARFGPDIGKTHVTTCVRGTSGYIDPNYFATGCLSVKTDIYSFGVLLLETLMGQQAFDVLMCDERDEQNDVTLDEQNVWLRWARPFLADKSELKKIMDLRLKGNYPLEGAFKCATLALRCLAYNSKDRPSSEEIMGSLKQIHALHK